AMSIRAIAAHSFWYIDPDIGSPLHSSYVGTKVPHACCGLLSLDVKLLRLCFMPNGITKGSQCPAVPSEGDPPPRRPCSMPRATGRPVALLPSRGSVTAPSK